MNLSVFDVIGPVMIGPSSSHTAGAAKLARIAAALAPDDFSGVTFGMHGSFAKTGRGHSTDKALLAGVLGLHEDDERIRDAFEIAKERGIFWSFVPLELPEAHENAVRLTFHYSGDESYLVEGSSIGGGRISITNINGIPTEVHAEAPTLILSQRDVKGVVGNVTGLLAEHGINIGVIRLGRVAKGTAANMVLETDANIPPDAVEAIAALPDILHVCVLNI